MFSISLSLLPNQVEMDFSLRSNAFLLFFRHFFELAPFASCRVYVVQSLKPAADLLVNMKYEVVEARSH